jgi:hypothetical protein
MGGRGLASGRHGTAATPTAPRTPATPQLPPGSVPGSAARCMTCLLAPCLLVSTSSLSEEPLRWSHSAKRCHERIMNMTVDRHAAFGCLTAASRQWPSPRLALGQQLQSRAALRRHLRPRMVHNPARRRWPCGNSISHQVPPDAWVTASRSRLVVALHIRSVTVTQLQLIV